MHWWMLSKLCCALRSVLGTKGPASTALSVESCGVADVGGFFSPLRSVRPLRTGWLASLPNLHPFLRVHNALRQKKQGMTAACAFALSLHTCMKGPSCDCGCICDHPSIVFSKCCRYELCCCCVAMRASFKRSVVPVAANGYQGRLVAVPPLLLDRTLR